MRYENTNKGCNKFYYTKLCTALIFVYHTAKVDTYEYFTAELSQFMSGMRRNIAKDIHNGCEKFEVGKSPLFLPIYR